MELYYKKLNMKNINNNVHLYNNSNNQKEKDITEKLNKSVFIQKMLKRKNIPNLKNALNLSAQNYNKVFSNVENLFINDNSKKNAIKYVIQIGKTN